LNETSAEEEGAYIFWMKQVPVGITSQEEIKKSLKMPKG
jgi:hypothetical protein